MLGSEKNQNVALIAEVCAGKNYFQKNEKKYFDLILKKFRGFLYNFRG